MSLKSREKILILLALIAAAIWAFDSFYYTPRSGKIKTLKAEVEAADLKLKESPVVAKGVEMLEVEVLRQEGELKRLSDRTSKGEEFRTFLKHLARESNTLQMKVISLTPQGDDFQPRQEKKEGSPSPYRRVTVQMVLHSTYAKLGNYLKGIEELPFLICVDNIEVEKNEQSLPLLKVTVGLSMYIREESKGIKG